MKYGNGITGRDHRIYFILVPPDPCSETGYVKIGYTSDLDKRLKQHAQTEIGDDLLGAIRGMRHTETKWHRRFAHCRVRGERELYYVTAELDLAISRTLAERGTNKPSRQSGAPQ